MTEHVPADEHTDHEGRYQGMRKRLGFSLWLLPLFLIGVTVLALLISSIAPYTPLDLRSYRITPQVVCPQAPVMALVSRKYETEFSALELEEAWVTVRGVEGLPPGRPVITNEGVLPPMTLKPTDGYRTVVSPLLDQAPSRTGVYRVRISAEYHGYRWGFLPAVGELTFFSNEVRVVPCGAQTEGG